jgi:hypothetical protein
MGQNGRASASLDRGASHRPMIGNQIAAHPSSRSFPSAPSSSISLLNPVFLYPSLWSLYSLSQRKSKAACRFSFYPYGLSTLNPIHSGRATRPPAISPLSNLLLPPLSFRLLLPFGCLSPLFILAISTCFLVA